MFNRKESLAIVSCLGAFLFLIFGNTLITLIIGSTLAITFGVLTIIVMSSPEDED